MNMYAGDLQKGIADPALGDDMSVAMRSSRHLCQIAEGNWEKLCLTNMASCYSDEYKASSLFC